MPYKSEKQRRFFNSPTGMAKLGAEKVHEFNEASKGMKLPESKKKGAGVKSAEKPTGIARLKAKLKAMK